MAKAVATPAAPEVDFSVLSSDFNAAHLGHVAYVWGEKPELGSAPGSFHGSDCSGYVRWAVERATGGVVKLPEGSDEQHDWAKAHLGAPVAYGAAGLTHGKLFLCFIRPTSDHAGHVWFLHDAHTMECHGGSGLGSRVWNARPLPQEVAECFVWPSLHVG